jgi:solute carrier family 27 fatty acid transporter 1/4
MDSLSGEAASVPNFVLPAPEVADTFTAENLLDVKLQSAEKIPRSARAGVKLLDCAFQVMTSGTTGLPKAAVVSNMKYLLGCGAFTRLYFIKKSDVVYITLPLCHSSANQIGVGLTIYNGLSCVLRRKFSATLYMEDCAKYKATVAQYIGELLRYVVATPPSKYDHKHKLRIVVGNGLRPEVWQQVIDRFKIPQVGEFYASTEGNANTFNIDNTFGSVGFVSKLLEHFYPIRFLRVDPISGDIIRDPATGFCVQCGVDEPGELVGLIKMGDPQRRFDGYTDTNATKKKLVRNVEKQGDLYFRTGDILRKNKRGNVSVFCVNSFALYCRVPSCVSACE